MRFLILTQYFPPEKGAAPTRLSAMVKVLKKAGHEVEIVTAMPNYPEAVIYPGYQRKFYVRETYEGCRVHRFWLYAAKGKGLARMLNYLTFALMACFGIFFAKKPDWIFVNSGPLFLSIPGYIASKVWQRPYIFNVADLWPESISKIGAVKNGIALKALERLEKWSYQNARIVTAVTQGIADVLIRDKHLSQEKVCFLPNGVDTDLFSPREPSERVLDRHNLRNKIVFMYPGTHGYLHALENVLDAAYLLREKENIAFLLIGGGSEKPKLVEYAAKLRIKNVTFVDAVDQIELAEYISVASFGLIHQRNTPLANETRPAKAFPLMAMGKPILFAGFGEGATLIEKANAGIIIPPENAQLLCETVLELTRDPKTMQSMGLNGRKLVENSFSWDQLVQSWLAELLDKTKENVGIATHIPAKR